MITIRVARRQDGMLDFVKEGPGYTMRTDVRPVYEKLDAQLAVSGVFEEERKQIIGHFNAFGKAVLSFPERKTAFFCLG
jgi:hypothetical protein